MFVYYIHTLNDYTYIPPGLTNTVSHGQPLFLIQQPVACFVCQKHELTCPRTKNTTHFIACILYLRDFLDWKKIAKLKSHARIKIPAEFIVATHAKLFIYLFIYNLFIYLLNFAIILYVYGRVTTTVLHQLLWTLKYISQKFKIFKIDILNKYNKSHVEEGWINSERSPPYERTSKILMSNEFNVTR
jgi:hypothetical protein